MRPRNRTLTQVHENILDDLFNPGSIVGKRTRVRLDGTKFIKVHVDETDKSILEDKVDAITQIYRKLTNKEVTVEFKKDETFHSIKK
mmetsp:Transcript_3937/g.5769  ORF Transcript_3937/g.5769 Transcript_3937/m.5769 type:complete len:87 (+) Transcript_3937:428-688(+)